MCMVYSKSNVMQKCYHELVGPPPNLSMPSLPRVPGHSGCCIKRWIVLGREKKGHRMRPKKRWRKNGLGVHTRYNDHLFLGSWRTVNSFLKIKYGNVCGGVQSKNSAVLEENLLKNLCFPKRYPSIENTFQSSLGNLSPFKITRASVDLSIFPKILDANSNFAKVRIFWFLSPSLDFRKS